MLVWRLDLCETFITYFVGKIPSIFISDTKPVTSAACDSPHKASAAPGLFHSSYLRKVEKYFCVVRWISRLYSLQYSPWIPTVPFLRLLLAHAFYLCQENMKLNVFFFCFLTIAFHLVSLTYSLSFWKKLQSNTAQFSTRSVVGDVIERQKFERDKKKKVFESFLLVSFSLCCKSKETKRRLSS